MVDNINKNVIFHFHYISEEIGKSSTAKFLLKQFLCEDLCDIYEKISLRSNHCKVMEKN